MEIYKLLEPKEKEQIIIQERREKLEEMCGQFGIYVVLTVFKNIQSQFNKYGRSVCISPGCFSFIPPGRPPKLRINVPDGRSFNYWLEIKLTGKKVWIERHLSIGRRGDMPQVVKVLMPLSDDLSSISEEDLQRDIFELYQRHIMMNNFPLRHAQ